MENLRAIAAAVVVDDEDVMDVPVAQVATAGLVAVTGAVERGDSDARVEDFFERVVPGYSDPLFKVHFRMTRPTVEVSFLFTSIF